MTAAALPALFDELSFGGEWRRYQKAGIAAFERDRAAGRRRTHIVAPPGSGKTLVGVELVRRVGRRALVLAPNGAIQMQWPRAVALVPGVGDHAAARATPVARRRRAGAVRGLPAPLAAPGARRRALPRLGRAGAARGRAARRGVSPPARPRGLARAARGLRAALPAPLRRGGRGRPLRSGGRRARRAGIPAHAAGDPARHLGGRPAADRLAGEGDRARRGARGGDGVARRRAARARAVRRRAGRGQARSAARRRARSGCARRAPNGCRVRGSRWPRGCSRAASAAR